MNKKQMFPNRTQWLVSYRVYIRLYRHSTDQNLFLERIRSFDWFTDVRIYSWREWEALTDLRNNENLPFDIENEVHYLQLLLLSCLLIL